MIWQYRLVKIGDEVGLYEVYFDEDNNNLYRTTNPASIVFDVDDRKNDIMYAVMRAFMLDVIDDKEFDKEVF